MSARLSALVALLPATVGFPVRGAPPPARAAISAALTSVPALPAAAETTTTVRFEVGGIPVILRRNPANDVVAANLYLLGGARQLTPETQGIEALLLTASERGTRRYPGATARQRTARLGSTIAVETTDDWSALSLHAVRSTFDSTWSIFADRLMAPTLRPREVELAREQLLSAAREKKTSPDGAVTALADSLLYAGHPYALTPAGTVASLAALSPDQLRHYRDQQLVTSRMLLVVVGNVDRPQLERLVRTTLATLPRGDYRWTLPPAVPRGERSLVIEQRALPTNYLTAYVAGPVATSADYMALRVAAAVLSGRLFAEVRSRRNLSYAVEAPFLERASAVAGLYVTTVSPNDVLRIMRDELTTLQTELVDPVGLKRLEQQFLTEYYLKNETNDDQADQLARAELYQGDYRAAARFRDALRQVRPEDVRRVAREYLTHFRVAYVGDAARLDRSLLAQF